MVRNTYIFPPEPSMRIVSDIFAYTARRMPKFNSISISGYHMQEAGATADLELAYTLADGVEYVRAGLAAGLDVDALRAAASFFWAIGMNFFMEVAKLRAARLLWAKLVEQFEPKNPRSLALRTHCQTSGWSLDGAGRVQQRRAHLHRGDGGDPRPHPVAAHQRARRGAGAADRLLGPHRPQHPAPPPAGVRDTRDDRPVGRQLLRRAADRRPRGARAGAHRTRSRRSGGMAAAIEAGHPEAAHRGGGGPHPGAHRRRPPDRRGVNKYRPDEPERVEVLKVDNAAVRARQIAKLEQLRAERDELACRRALDALTRCAGGAEGNLLELASDRALPYLTSRLCSI